MTVPSVTINELDNQIGVAIASGDVLALIGPAAGGVSNAPAAYSRTKDIVSTFADGPIVEDAAYIIDNRLAGSVVMVKTDITTVGGYGAVTLTGTGTSVPTGNTGTEPYGEYDVRLLVLNGGTLGVAGIVFQYSLDNGRNWSAPQTLGTALFCLLPHNIRINFAAGTLVTGDLIKVRTSAPKWSAAQLATAIGSLKLSTLRWALGLIAGPLTSADVAAIDTAASGLKTVGKYRRFLGNFRTPTVGESEATYKAAADTALGASVCSRLCIGFGYARIQSPISQLEYRRPAMLTIAGRAISIARGTDCARVKDGPLPASVRITDDAGNPDEHDEYMNPGADDSRFSTLRTWPGRKGVFVNGARLFSATGSDYVYLQHGRVMDAAAEYVFQALSEYSSDDVLVDPDTGFILESEAADIERTINEGLKTALVDPRYVSAARFTLSRTDNLLVTFALDGAVTVTPKGYVKSFTVDLGLYNPANAPTEGV